ncbi:N-acetylneuraminate lyase [Amyelois transitella]|uniref:N-acetylneuraminate lyase n=1 Tax=Amyelois transitella TaxID=680683 RepID=UPI00067C7702|nr:N-acetylneuraminate lyase [Amyelois transitella]
MVSFSIQGVMPAMFTALNEDYSINYDIIPRYAKYIADCGVKAILVGGTTGEHASLKVEDRKKLISEWVKVAKPLGMHVQVQIGGTAFPYVIELAKHCEQVGVDSLLTLPELYFKPSSVDDLVFYVEQIAKAAPKLPILYYHTPKRSKVELDMPAFVTAATSRIPNFVGIKFANSDLSVAAQVLKVTKDDQALFLSADTLVAPAAMMGVRYFMGISFGLFPGLVTDIVQAVENNNVEKARVLQEKLNNAKEAHSSEGDLVVTLKAGMKITTGLDMGPPALPQRPISAEAIQRIRAKLNNLGLAK